ncbi:MAG: signal peptidase II, partial [Rhodocyclaceae bacterium]|nr:signal peptidase II [Rhodocyclaceae bacterium]
MPRFVRWLALALFVILCDQASKAAILAAFQYGERYALTGFFNLVLVMNPGASFSFLADAGGWQKWFFTLLALAISAWLILMLRAHAAQTLPPLAFALILGGALGNVI